VKEAQPYTISTRADVKNLTYPGRKQ